MWREYFCAGTSRRYWWRMAVLMTLYLGAIVLAVRHVHAVESLLALGLLDQAGVVQVRMFLAAPVLLAIYVPAQVVAHWRYR